MLRHATNHLPSGHDVKGLRAAFADKIPGKLILQDRPEVIHLASLDPTDSKMPHDFLTPQPIQGTPPPFLSLTPPTNPPQAHASTSYTA